MFIGFTNEYEKFIGIFNVKLNQNVSQEKLQEMMEIINSQIIQPYKNTKKIFIYPSLLYLQNIFGEAASVLLDENLFYYGLEYTESMLKEWSETYDPKAIVFFSYDKFVCVEQEGSLSILADLINS
jgi:hypothetical protein